MNKLVLFVLLLMSIFSCTDNYGYEFTDNLNQKEKPLRIITRALSIIPPKPIQEFTEGSVIGLHITSERTGSLYENNADYKNVQTVAYIKDSKLNWQQRTIVLLNSEPASIYAYYPYQPQANFDPENIPVKISPDASQTIDYMYGTQACGQKAISKISPIAWINMNHAMALLDFQIHLTPQTSGCYLLSAIQTGNQAGGTVLCGQGTLNIKTGEIGGCAGVNASTRLNMNTPHMLTMLPGEAHQFRVIPTTRIISKGDVQVLFVINGKTFNYNIPAQTKWKRGHKYHYTLTFDGKTIRLDHITASKWRPIS